MAAATDERLIYEILSAVGEIPEGNVATYGQIAMLCGRPRNSRQVGYGLRENLARPSATATIRATAWWITAGGSCPAGTRRRRCSRARA